MHPLVFFPGAGGQPASGSPWRIGWVISDRRSCWLGRDWRFPDGFVIESLDGLYRWMLGRLPSTSIHLVAQFDG